MALAQQSVNYSQLGPHDLSCKNTIHRANVITRAKPLEVILAYARLANVEMNQLVNDDLDLPL
jgi:hypothetical protein